MNIIRALRDAIRTFHEIDDNVRQLIETLTKIGNDQAAAINRSATDQAAAIERVATDQAAAIERVATDQAAAIDRLATAVKALDESVHGKAALAARLQATVNELDKLLVQSSPLFDREWYLKQYPDVDAIGKDPLEHYVRVGWREGRNPSPFFLTNVYLDQQPAVRAAGINPLVYYLRSVAASQENRRIAADWQFLQSDVASEADALDTRFKTRLSTSNPSAVIGSPAIAPTQAQRIRAATTPNDAKPLKLLIVSYGTYDNNSAIQITGLANALTSLGHNVVVSAAGEVSRAGDLGTPRFRCIPHEVLRQNPAILTNDLDGSASGGPDLIHCWTPRTAVRDIAGSVTKRFDCPYIVHFEDNESAIDNAYRGDTRKAAPEDLDPSQPSRPTIPKPMREFIAGAAGASVIVDALRTFLPEKLPIQLFEPGVDAKWFAPALGADERDQLCRALEVPANAWVTVYPGNIHPANAEEMFSLYAAIHALNARGFNVHLIRTGTDSLAAPDPRFVELTKRHVTSLGVVRRDWLLELLRMADFFVQPGAPDSFNNYRLPSKIPEFLAVGRPLVLPKSNIGLLMRHRKDALLMHRGDAAEITECVASLLSDPVLADRLGRNGRHFASEHFDWEKTALAMEGFYQKVRRRRSCAAAAEKARR